MDNSTLKKVQPKANRKLTTSDIITNRPYLFSLFTIEEFSIKHCFNIKLPNLTLILQKRHRQAFSVQGLC